jgi:hypothetical protein
MDIFLLGKKYTPHQENLNFASQVLRKLKVFYPLPQGERENIYAPVLNNPSIPLLWASFLVIISFARFISAFRDSM